MKSLLIFTFLAGAGYLGWRTGGSLDSDAMGMAVGIVLGVGAAIPTALLLLASGRRRNAEKACEKAARRAYARSRHQGLPEHAGYAPHQPPVIVLAGAGMQPGAQAGHFGPQPMGMDGWGEARPERRFKMVGEQEAWIDEW